MRRWEKQKYALDHNQKGPLIAILLLRSKPFSDLKFSKNYKMVGDFRKFSPLKILFFENFQNDRREFSNSSFDREFRTEKHYADTFFMKATCEEIGRHIVFYSCMVSQNQLK